MIESGWPFVWAAYAVSLGALAVLAIVVVVRALHWARAARELDKP